MAKKNPFDEFGDEAVEIFQAYQTELAALVAAAIEAADDVSALEAVQAKILAASAAVADDLREFAGESVAVMLAANLAKDNAALVDAGLAPITPESFNQLHGGAIDALKEELGDILEEGSDKLAEGLFRSIDAQKDILEAALAGFEGGLTRDEAIESLLAKLRERGIVDETGTILVTGKDGVERAYDATKWARMQIETKMTQAASHATQVTIISTGNDLAKISQHFDDRLSSLCAGYQGVEYSLTGKTQGFPLLSSVPNGGPPLHPNCRHTLSMGTPSSRVTDETRAKNNAAISKAKKISTRQENAGL